MAALDKLKDQITCSVCLDVYTNPRTLPCLHSFCHSCLELLPQQKEGSNYKINCPQCRALANISKVEDFPIAFQINNLKDLYNLFEKASNKVKCENCNEHDSAGYCIECSQFLCKDCINMHTKWLRFKEHQIQDIKDMTSGGVATNKKTLKVANCTKHDRPLEIFCETCDEVICQHCTVRIHRDHNYDLVSDCYRKSCTSLKDQLKPVNGKIVVVQSRLNAFNTKVDRLKVQRKKVKSQIQSYVQELIANLKQSEGALYEQVDFSTDKHLLELENDIAVTKEMLSHMTDSVSYVEQMLEYGSPQDVLSSSSNMSARLSSVMKLASSDDAIAKDELDVKFVKKISQNLFNIGQVTVERRSCLNVHKVISVEKVTYENDIVKFPLPVEGAFNIPVVSVSCQIIHCKSDELIPSDIFTDESGKHFVSCKPNTNGPHLVNVKLNDEQIGNVQLIVPVNPLLKQIAPVSTVSDLVSPYGVAVSDSGLVAVTEHSSNCIAVLDKYGKRCASLGKDNGTLEFSYPRGIAVTTDNCLIVSDNHKLQKITWDGELVKLVGSLGSEALQFSAPCGIAVSSSTGTIYVVESTNHRIQVLNHDLTFSFMFGTRGPGAGQFTRPRDIALDNNGFLYVSDAGNHRIQKFTQQGEFVCSISSHGVIKGQLNRPHGIVVDNNNFLYIAEVANYRVSVFTTDGQFVGCFGEEGGDLSQFKGPAGISYSCETGQLYVCDFYNKRLIVY